MDHAKNCETSDTSDVLELKKKITGIIIDNNYTNTILTPNEGKYILEIFNSNSKILVELKSLIDEILKDGKIDYHDIPYIVLFISKVFSIYAHNYINININGYNIIKFLTESIVFSYIKTLDDIDIILFDKILEVSIALLKETPSFCQRGWNYISMICCSRKNKIP
jgi:DNA-directed RNA polymerase